jgi:hypothetical protein
LLLGLVFATQDAAAPALHRAPLHLASLHLALPHQALLRPGAPVIPAEPHSGAARPPVAGGGRARDRRRRSRAQAG